MYKNNINIAIGYYTAMSERNIEKLAGFLHQDVTFVGPLAQMSGKEAVVQSVKNFSAFFNTLTIRTQFGSDHQAMLVYDLEFPAPIGSCHASVLLDIKDSLITRIELFYDARPFEIKKDAIFSK